MRDFGTSKHSRYANACASCARPAFRKGLHAGYSERTQVSAGATRLSAGGAVASPGYELGSVAENA
jgi:hypothetical protein